jgi:hypothetical protein
MKSMPSPRISGMTPDFPGASVLGHAKSERVDILPLEVPVG